MQWVSRAEYWTLLCLECYTSDSLLGIKYHHHHFSNPVESKYAMLKITGAPLHVFFQTLTCMNSLKMTGRVGYTAQRYSKANNKYMKSYDKDK